ERPANPFAGGSHRLLGQIGVAITPDPQNRTDDGWRSLTTGTRGRRAARAIPVQSGRQGTRSGEVGNVAIDVDRIARPLAEQLPVLPLQLILCDTSLTKKRHVPRLLPLFD